MNTANLSSRQNALLHSLRDVGTMWARHGVNVGISAVRTQAEMLRTASTTLERAAEVIAAAAKPIMAEPATSGSAATVDTTAEVVTDSATASS